MKLEDFLIGWRVNRKKALLSKSIDTVEPSTKLNMTIFHVGMLARDLCRQAGIWPDKIILQSHSPVGSDLKERFAARGIELSNETVHGEALALEEPLSLDVGLDFSSTCLENGRGKFLVIKFAGNYPTGSQGDAQGYFIYRMICLDAELNAPDAIVLDLSKLTYTWGDGLEIHPPGFVNLDSRIGILIRDEQVEPYSYVISKERMYFSLESAIESV